MNKEGRKALGHQQDASSIFTHKAFILQMTPKNMYTTPWSACGKDRERGLMLGVRWSDGCCVPMHLAWISVAVIEPPNIQASTLLQILIRSLESHCQTTAVNTRQILDKALHKRAHLRGCGCVCLYVCVLVLPLQTTSKHCLSRPQTTWLSNCRCSK